jgi:hypothetical protein
MALRHWAMMAADSPHQLTMRRGQRILLQLQRDQRESVCVMCAPSDRLTVETVLSQRADKGRVFFNCRN